jgi:hypothetical protein
VLRLKRRPRPAGYRRRRALKLRARRHGRFRTCRELAETLKRVAQDLEFASAFLRVRRRGVSVDVLEDVERLLRNTVRLVRRAINRLDVCIVT